ncbi:MAG: amidohydrolase family protein [Halobacteriota archaeon]
MAKASTGSVTSLSDVELIVDTDVHLTERQEDFLPYIEDPFRTMLGRGQTSDWGFHSNLYTTPGVFSPLTTGKTDADELRTREDIVAAMEMLDLDRVIITPTLNLFLGAVQYPELAAALATAYNEWLLDEIVDVDQGIYGSTVVAPQLPEKAAEEIDDRASERGIAAVMFPSGGVSPPLGNKQYYPIYEASEDAGLPVLLHNTSTGSGLFNFPLQYQGYTRFLTTHIFHVVQHIVNVPDIIFQGVPVRFPDLDFVFQEGGIGWIPYLMRRLDHDYSGMREDAPMLEKLPSEYMRDFYYSSQPIEGLKEDPQYVLQMLAQMDAPDTLLFATDYPHFDFDHTSEMFNLLRSSFDGDEVEAMLGGTATEIFEW